MNAQWHKLHPMPKSATLAQRIAWHRDHQSSCSCRPIPPKWASMLKSKATRSGSAAGALRRLLAGGDRRSIAHSDRALSRIQALPELVAEVAGLADDEDWLISMRSMDLLEKLAHQYPAWSEPHRRLFIGPLADSDKWEIRLQIVRALPLFAWTPAEMRGAREILLRDVEHPQKFVRAWALDSLATLAQKDSSLMPAVRRWLREFESSGSKALAARARRIRERFEVPGGQDRT
jgi:hypothetical protein